MGQNPAPEEGLEFLGDMLGEAFALEIGPGLESPEIRCDRLVEYGLLRPPGPIGALEPG